jgi:hypothetical protein
VAARATIGALIVSVGANTGLFEKGMKRTQKGLKKFEKSAKSTTKVMQNLRLGLAAAFTGITINKISSEFFELASSIDALSKASKNLGVGTEQLGGLHHAAQLSGVSTEKLNIGLKRMIVSIDDASRGLERATRAFATLNIDIDQLRRLSPEEQFKQIADGLRSIQNNTERVAISDAIFGRNGVELINLLNQGSNAIESMAQSYKDLGASITDKDAENVAAMNDALSKLATTATGFGKELVINVAPAVADTANALLEVIQGIRELRGRPGAETAADRRRRALEQEMGGSITRFRQPLDVRVFRPLYQPILNNLNSIITGRYAFGPAVSQPNIVGPQRATRFPPPRQQSTEFGGVKLDQINNSLKQLTRIIEDGIREGDTGDRVFFRPQGIYTIPQSTVGP